MRLGSRAHDFHYSIEKRCGKLGHYVSFNEIHVLYNKLTGNPKVPGSIPGTEDDFTELFFNIFDFFLVLGNIY